MRKSFRVSGSLGAIVFVGASAAALLGASPAGAAQSQQTLTCDGQHLVVSTNNNNSSEMGGWSAAKIVSGGSGTLIPTSFSGGAFDQTVGQPIFHFSQIKGNGNGNHNQPTVTCTQVETGTLSDFVDPGQAPPPGTSLDDQVTFTLTAIAVHQP
jgi:hypothetical protein